MMDFETRITRMPVPYDGDRGREARAAVASLQGDLARLIEGACGCSPYLKTLVEKEAAWLPDALAAPEAALATVLAGIADAPPISCPRICARPNGAWRFWRAWPIWRVSGR